MELIKNSPKHWEFIRNLRNMNGVRQGFIEQNSIDEIQHATYMLKYNNNFWICVDNDEPMGYIGVIDNDIRVATHPNFQGQGIGSFMINEIMKLHPDAFAKVKLDNEASLRLFEKCGFKKRYYLLERE
jgi:ribosomal protein S18 acetylase RimI-like enzyme|tara:strand:+ start:9264 stop:9647 length:384 start_codon:yes stop_codon:yes gene_type:complete